MRLYVSGCNDTYVAMGADAILEFPAILLAAWLCGIGHWWLVVDWVESRNLGVPVTRTQPRGSLHLH